MRLSGKIVKIVDSKFTGKDGEEKHSKTVIIEEITNRDNKDKAVFELWGERADKFEFLENQNIEVTFGFKVEEREYEGKTYYTQKLLFWRAEII